MDLELDDVVEDPFGFGVKFFAQRVGAERELFVSWVALERGDEGEEGGDITQCLCSSLVAPSVERFPSVQPASWPVLFPSSRFARPTLAFGSMSPIDPKRVSNSLRQVLFPRFDHRPPSSSRIPPRRLGPCAATSLPRCACRQSLP